MMKLIKKKENLKNSHFFIFLLVQNFLYNIKPPHLYIVYFLEIWLTELIVFT